MTRNTFSDTASIGEDFIKHYGVKGMKWGVRKDKEDKTSQTKSAQTKSTQSNSAQTKSTKPKSTKPKSTKPKSKSERIGEVVKVHPDGSKEIYVSPVGSYGRYLTDEEIDEAAEALKERDAIEEQMDTLDEEMLKVDEEYQKLDSKRTLTSDEAKRRNELKKEGDRLMDESDKLWERGMELTERHYAIMEKAQKAHTEARKKDPSTPRAITMPEPGTDTYISGKDPAKPGQTRFKVDKDRRARHFDDSDYLKHYGVKGMKWGVRKDLKKLPSKKAREAYIANKDSKWRDKAEDPKKAIRAAKRASREATRMTKELNRKYKDMGYKLKGNTLRKTHIDNRKNRMVRNQYDIELRGILESSLDSAAYKVYKNSPTRLYQVNLSRGLDGTVSAKIAPRQNPKLDKQRASITKKARKLKHSDDGSQDLSVKMEEDEDGFVIDIQLPVLDLEFAEDENKDEDALDHSDLSELGSDFIQHYGVKGMKWGVRKDGKPQGYQGGSSSGKRKKKRKNNLAKRRLERAKSKLERQRIKERASEYEKSTEESKRKVRENEKAASADSKPKSDPKPKSKSVRELSDDDLNKIIRRIELEKRYSTLMEEQRPKSTTEKVNKVLKKAATEAATNVTKQLMTNAMKAAVTRATGVALPEEKKKK